MLIFFEVFEHLFYVKKTKISKCEPHPPSFKRSLSKGGADHVGEDAFFRNYNLAVPMHAHHIPGLWLRARVGIWAIVDHGPWLHAPAGVCGSQRLRNFL